ncbi:MAG TPA: hypothetical protein PLU50_11830 [Pseudobdellovibrionaceae bacterium]|nr:hypothetical protein [Pseudobdellovibrionaceae bacterium]
MKSQPVQPEMLEFLDLLLDYEVAENHDDFEVLTEGNELILEEISKDPKKDVKAGEHHGS